MYSLDKFVCDPAPDLPSYSLWTHLCSQSMAAAEREQFLDDAAAWVHATLFSRDARDSLAKDLVAEGRLEVTGLAPGVAADQVGLQGMCRVQCRVPAAQ